LISAKLMYTRSTSSRFQYLNGAGRLCTCVCGRCSPPCLVYAHPLLGITPTRFCVHHYCPMVGLRSPGSRTSPHLAWAWVWHCAMPPTGLRYLLLCTPLAPASHDLARPSPQRCRGNFCGLSHRQT